MPDLTQITSQGGVPFTVATPYADRFQNLIDGLEQSGYPISADQSGGYNPRNIAGTNTPSEHAYGRAIDVNWNDNPKGGKSTMPPDLARSLAKQHGFTWGGDWSGKTNDPMHFQIDPSWQAPQNYGPMALGGPQSPAQTQTPQTASLQPQPQRPAMGILSAPQTDDSDYSKQLRGILGGLQGNSNWQALTALGAGIAGNAQGAGGGWGPGIGAGLQGANAAYANNSNKQMSLLEALAGEHARQQQLALQAAGQKQALQLADKTQIVKTGQDSWGHDLYSKFKPISDKLEQIAPQGANGEATSPKDIADGIVRGDLPPDLAGMYKQKAPIMAMLSKTVGTDGKPFNLETAQLQDKAARRQIITLNGSQTTRLVGLQQSVANTINEVDDLADKMKQGGVPIINSANLLRLKETQGNTPQGQLAGRYITAVNTLKEEFANAANGGYAPTDAAWKLANDQINGNFGHQQLRASLGEIQRLINYRVHAIPNIDKIGPNAANPYTGSGNPQGVGVGLGSAPVDATGNPQAAPQVPAPQGAPAGPAPGSISKGYRFKGGNPADPHSWEKA
jgi:D-alanyl-D-alanine carboxypeptidase